MLAPERLARLTETAHLVDELLNRTPEPGPALRRQARVRPQGRPARRRVRADAQTFEHIDPAVVGNSRDVLISELSGRGTIVEKAREAGIAADERLRPAVVERVKELEHAGFQFEAADGSFELLMRREAGDYEPLFRLESWRVIVEKHADGHVDTEATIKIWVDGERYVRTAEGNGPVNALDRALRDAIGEIHPQRDIDLVNFKVRILDETKGTGAVTRVLIDASDGHDVWGSIGVSENLIAASWDALVDSLEYGMQERQRALRVPPLSERCSADPVGESGVMGRSRWLGLCWGRMRSGLCWTCCARGSSRLGRGCRRSSRLFAARVGAAWAALCRAGPPGCIWRCGRSGLGTATRSLPARSRLSPRPTPPCTSARRPCSRTSILSRSTSTRMRRPPLSPSARGRCCRCISSAIRRTCPRSSGSRSGMGWGSSRTLARRLARSCRWDAGGGAGHPAVFGFYANKQLTTGEGGMVTLGDEA